MIPLFVCDSDGPVCLVGMAWNPAMLAAFLSWWMPLNLVSWLALLIFIWMREGKIGKNATTLPWILWMMCAFWAMVTFVVIDHFVKRLRRWWRTETA